MTHRRRLDRAGFALMLAVLVAILLMAWSALLQPTPAGALGNGSMAEIALPRSIAAPVSSSGDAELGRNLFMGTIHFENGGPPCMGCHSLGSTGILGGGALGPDLTGVAARRTQDQLQGILANSKAARAPVMQPIYAEHPLTAAEQADLLAFMNASVGQPQPNLEWLVIGISLAGFVAAIVLIELVYRRRLRGVRKPLVRQAQPRRS